MKYNTLKRIGRIALIGSILYFLNTKESIAPEIEYITIESSKPIIKDTRKVIVLDPGHGKNNAAPKLMDWGMTYQDYKEAEIVLEKAKNIQKMLDSTKYKVILTREDNVTPCPIESRPEIANKNNADLFISLHVNDYKGWKSISGSEVYWRYEKDKEFANLAAKNLEEMTSIPNRYVSWGEYLMLKDVKCPAALLDVGYLLNEGDREKILNESGVERAVVKTIEVFLNQAKDSSETITNIYK
jgi:N-acetylmuramoyl-L-alanine amidase